MKVQFIGIKEKGKATEQLKTDRHYNATESIYSDYYELEEVEGFRFLKSLFRRVA